jgi:hyperosmotically inducible protein
VPLPAIQFNHIKGNIIMKISKFLATLLVAISMVAVVGCASTTKQESTGEYVDDSVLTTKVKAAIFNEPTLKSMEVNVETFKGVVQLSGFVSSQAAENKAVEVARTVHGVKSVKNDMRVK